MTEGEEEREATEVGKMGEEKEALGSTSWCSPMSSPRQDPRPHLLCPTSRAQPSPTASETCRDGAAGPCALGLISFSLKTPDAIAEGQGKEDHTHIVTCTHPSQGHTIAHVITHAVEHMLTC